MTRIAAMLLTIALVAPAEAGKYDGLIAAELGIATARESDAPEPAPEPENECDGCKWSGNRCMKTHGDGHQTECDEDCCVGDTPGDAPTEVAPPEVVATPPAPAVLPSPPPESQPEEPSADLPQEFEDLPTPPVEPVGGSARDPPDNQAGPAAAPPVMLEWQKKRGRRYNRRRARY